MKDIRRIGDIAGQKLSETINLEVEAPLWRQICGYAGVDSLLKSNPRILIIGTDSSLKLADTIRTTTSGSEIDVIESSDRIHRVASQKAFSLNVNLYKGSYPNDASSEIKRNNYGLIIFKHGIVYNMEEIGSFTDTAKDQLTPDGLFFASAPIFQDSMVKRALDKSNVPYVQQKFKGLFGGSIFVFNKNP